METTKNQLNNILEQSFGLSTQEKKVALLENLYIAGYLQDEKIWEAIFLMQFDKDGNKINLWNKEENEINSAFFTIISDLHNSNSNQEDPDKFDATKLLNNFDKNKTLDKQAIENLIVYLSQNAFGREKGAERNEIQKQNWMDIHKDRYLKNAAKLGMIDEILPKDKNYTETWIMGAARNRLEIRIKYLKNLIDKEIINSGEIRLLTGERELWIEIDKINEDKQEAKQYILNLAKQNNIKTNKSEPFTIRNIADSSRTYLNYADNENRKVTETMMAKDIFNSVFGYEIYNIIDSKTDFGKSRPDTGTNAGDASEIIKERIKKEEIKNPKILIISNQPYCERQAINNKRIADSICNSSIFFDFTGEEIGKENAEKMLQVIHSETACLLYEYFATQMENELRKVPVENLMYSTRNNEIEIDKMPNITESRAIATLDQSPINTTIPKKQAPLSQKDIAANPR